MLAHHLRSSNDSFLLLLLLNKFLLLIISLLYLVSSRLMSMLEISYLLVLSLDGVFSDKICILFIFSLIHELVLTFNIVTLITSADLSIHFLFLDGTQLLLDFELNVLLLFPLYRLV